jgi:hypothetical protein
MIQASSLSERHPDDSGEALLAASLTRIQSALQSLSQTRPEIPAARAHALHSPSASGTKAEESDGRPHDGGGADWAPAAAAEAKNSSTHR